MDKDGFFEEIMHMDVFDTHSHLIGDNLNANDFWKIGEYFWLLQELQAAGYPKNPEQLPEDQRIQAYVKALNMTRNTSMNWVVRNIFKNLFGIELKDEKSIRLANEAVQATSSDINWAQDVAKQLSIKNVTVNYDKHIPFNNMPGTGVLVPRIDGYISQWVKEIAESENQLKAAEKVTEDLDKLLNGFAKSGCKAIMTTLRRFNLRTNGDSWGLNTSNNSVDQIMVYILHVLCSDCEKYNLLIQFFLGVENGWSSNTTSANDTNRILNLHGLFDKYNCQFELVVASEINTMDVVQAARLFPNVHVGGLWWFTFRPSIFMDTMQKRFEAIPPSKSSLIVSDARCIEWCYGKVLLIKHLVADYLYKQITSGWINRDEAMWIAKEWLYMSAAVRYGVDKRL